MVHHLLPGGGDSHSMLKIGGRWLVGWLVGVFGVICKRWLVGGGDGMWVGVEASYCSGSVSCAHAPDGIEGQWKWA